ncbi:MAG TPA: hypothetical protein VLT82_01265 [Myxococcaceae bacterium]|nr:hypothetical protein [Myxococcaceae bacterium]
MTRRVLLASLNAGGGHHALRDSFAAALARNDPEHQRLAPVVWNSADQFIDRFYSVCVRFLPRFQGKIVELSAQRWALRTAMALSPQLHTEATGMLRQQPFDLLVTTHPMQSMAFARARRELGLPTPLVIAVPDYGVPPTGYHPPLPLLRADALIVMEETTLEHYRALGLPDERLHLSGFLTREPFVRVGARLRSEGRDTARAALKAEVAAAHPGFGGFDLSRPTLLFLGGSAWTVKTEPVLDAVLADSALRGAANVVVVAGRDPAFEARLRPRAREGLHVFGFVAPEVLAALMGLADVPVLGSLAPATLQELLEVGLGPLLLFHFIPGSERAHVGYIETQRLGVYAPRTDEMFERIREVLGLRPASEALALARDGFRERARLLRTRSVERALQLPRFLERMMERPRESQDGARAVG